MFLLGHDAASLDYTSCVPMLILAHMKGQLFLSLLKAGFLGSKVFFLNLSVKVLVW